jgi:hypothetical protein
MFYMAKIDSSRFYGIAVPPAAEKLCREDLTFARTKKSDLVEAHLLSNFAYFGSIDKTLSGFYILDNEGDDYTLFDLREKNGQVYFLDHDEMILSVRFDSLAAYAKWRTAADKANSSDDSDDIVVPLPKEPKPRASREPKTSKLWGRYRWLVWLLAQPKQIDDEEAISTAIAKFESLCGGDFNKFGAAFERERESLVRDPHLAIYWLLHFTCIGDDASRDQVVEAVKKSKNELLRAFVSTFGLMESFGMLSALAAFRRRRSRVVFELAPKLVKNPFQLYLKSFQIDSTAQALDKATAVWAHAKTDADRQLIRTVLTDKFAAGIGADYLRIELAHFEGKPEKADWLLTHDPFRTRFLELALAGGSRGIESRLNDARETDGLLAAVLDATEKANANKKIATIVDIDKAVKPSLEPLARASPALRELAARRIIARSGDYANIAIVKAFEILLALKQRGEEHTRLLVTAMMRMSAYAPVEAAVVRAHKGDAESIALLWALVCFDERTCNEYHALYAKEMAIAGLGERMAEPKYFSTSLALLDQPGYSRFASAMFDKPLRERYEASILKRLTLAQRNELALAMLRQPPSRNSVYDKARDIVERMFSPALHKFLLAKLAKIRDVKQAKRYQGMLEGFDFSSGTLTKNFPNANAKSLVQELRNLTKSWK